MEFLLIMFFIYMAVKGDRKNFFTGRQFKKIKTAIGIWIGLSIFGALIPVLALLSPFVGFICVVSFCFWLAKKLWKHNANVKDDASGTYYSNAQYEQSLRGHYDASKKVNNVQVGTTGLSKSAEKRRKIIQNFNKKYELLLTESQIQRIVDASYYCPEWEKEIADMDKEYASVYEWFQGNTSWLRAYLRSFRVQSISSDFQQQKEICIAELDQIFANSNLANAASDDKVIRAINDKYYTAFDDVSFMIAYRFLRQNGHNYEIEARSVIPEYEAELEELRRKYEEMPM